MSLASFVCLRFYIVQGPWAVSYHSVHGVLAAFAGGVSGRGCVVPGSVSPTLVAEPDATSPPHQVAAQNIRGKRGHGGEGEIQTAAETEIQGDSANDRYAKAEPEPHPTTTRAC